MNRLVPFLLTLTVLAPAFAGELIEAESDKKAPVLAQYLFDRKATDWLEGTVINLNEKQFSVNKTQSFFAAKYVQMLNEINEKTTNFAPSEAARRASEIRSRWRTDIQGMLEDQMSDKEVVFLLPQTQGGLHVIDESGLYSREKISTSGDSRLTATDSYGKVAAWGDVKVGDRVVVGYQTSKESRNALVVIRVSSAAARELPQPPLKSFADVLEQTQKPK